MYSVNSLKSIIALSCLPAKNLRRTIMEVVVAIFLYYQYLSVFSMAENARFICFGPGIVAARSVRRRFTAADGALLRATADSPV